MNHITRDSIGLLVVTLASLAAAVLTLTNSQLFLLRVPFGILLTLFLPGYALSAAMFRKPKSFSIECMAFIIALSITIVIIGGLLLFLLTGSLSPRHWVLFLSFITVIECLVAYLRRIRHFKGLSLTIPVSRVSTQKLPALVSNWLLFGVAILIVFGSLRIAQNVAREYPKTPIVQMWIVPDRNNSSKQFRVGIMTSTDKQSRFSLLVKRGEITIQKWPELIMQPDDTWETLIELDPAVAGIGPVEGFLYDHDNPSEVFRHVSLWTNEMWEKNSLR